MDHPVIVQHYDMVAVITLNRPRYLNALNVEILDQMIGVVANIRDNPDVQALVITGSGHSFCAGGDLAFLRDYAGSKGAALGLVTQFLHRLILDLRQLPKPVIAAINGSAAGAGVSLCMACDLRIAADTTRFKQAYTSVGLVPDGGWNVLVARPIGPTRAAELLLLDKAFDAQAALELGLINRVVSSAELVNVAIATARQAAGRAAGFARSKALLNLALGPDLAQVLEAERQAIMAAGEGAAFKTALDKFFEMKG